LSPNRVNSLTKVLLTQLGVDTSHWKPHSTRGAGVIFWKNKGLGVEEIQQLGQCKNLGLSRPIISDWGSCKRRKKYSRVGGARAPPHRGGVHKTPPW
jgi:hypothetical protein